MSTSSSSGPSYFNDLELDRCPVHCRSPQQKLRP
jgi:hypothetical protein